MFKMNWKSSLDCQDEGKAANMWPAHVNSFKKHPRMHFRI